MEATQQLALNGQELRGSKSAIKRFSFKRIAKFGLILGLIASAESIAQSIGIVAAFPNEAARAKVIYGLASNSALGLFYGDRHADIISPAGYMVYRILPILALGMSIWAIIFTSRMLRGQEENGRWELLLTGERSAKNATKDTIIGILGGVVLSFIAIVAILSIVGHSHKYNVSLPYKENVFYALAVISGPVIAIGIGAITSQLASTAKRAVLYGMAPVIVLFALRSVGNIVDSLAWLKNLTPYGWIDKLHPYVHPQAIWFLPIAVLSLVLIATAAWLAGKRDLNESLIMSSDSARPKYKLLGSSFGFDFRENRNLLAGWLAGSLGMAALIASIDKSVANSLSGTGKLGKAFSHLTGNPNARIEIAFLSAAGYLVLILLMMMATNGISTIRSEEASDRLDNFVSGTLSRGSWLTQRLVLLSSAILLINLLASLVVWGLAQAQGVHVSIITLVFGGLNTLGAISFLLGVGVLLFGVLPRIATIVMYLIIIWSFTIDIISAAVHANRFIADSSLFKHISLVPAANADWKTFSILLLLGLVMSIGGFMFFDRRDLQSE